MVRENAVYTVVKNNTDKLISTKLVEKKGHISIQPFSFSVVEGSLLDDAKAAQKRGISMAISKGEFSLFLLVKTPFNSYQAVPMSPASTVQLTNDMIAAMVGAHVNINKKDTANNSKQDTQEKATSDKTNNVLAAKSVNLMSSFGAKVSTDQPIDHARNIRSQAYGFVKVTPGTADKKEVQQEQSAEEAKPEAQIDRQYVNDLYKENDYQAIFEFLKGKQYKDKDGNVVKVTKKVIMSCTTAQQLEEKLNFKFAD